MNKKVLIVEDQFVEAHDIQLMPERAGYEVCGIARSVAIAQEIIIKENPTLVLLDIFLKGKQTGIDLAKQLKEDNIAFIYLSANSNEDVLAAAKATEPYGFIVKPFREKDLLVTLEIAQYRHEHSRESKYRRESDMLRQLEKTISGNIEWSDKLLQIGKTVQLHIPFDLLSSGFDDPGKNAHSCRSFQRVGFDEYQAIGLKELLFITRITMDELTAIQAASGKETTASFFNNEAFEKVTQKPSLKKLFRDSFHMRSVLILPVQLANGKTFTFYFYSRRPDTYSAEHISLFNRLQQVLTTSIEQRNDASNFSNHSSPLQKENHESATRITNPDKRGFEGVIGNSHLLLNVFDQIAQVAPFETSVLILGESGTGKERIADCIHNLSPRKGKMMVKLNCASLPATLIESELFGHEKGSFTGATDRRIGKFEQANGGTIFLDEIGDMPIDLQVKLLRVLQEKEIEPIGSRSSIKINVRIIAATNRNLEKEVAEGGFRLDLYYRLNVFPIVLPALRERSEDIPALADHFITYYSRKSGKKVTSIADKVLKEMAVYSWPGNIRELENLIERSVLMARGTTIEGMVLPAGSKKDLLTRAQETRPRTIDENERDHIIAILKKSKGKVWGPDGAAEILGVPATTLKSKMKKLGIPNGYSE